MAEKLRECPFCGGDARAMPGSFVFGEKREWIAMCRECHARTRHYLTEGEVAEAWNRRAKEGR